MPEERRGWRKAQVCSRESACWVLCLKGFYLFSKGGNFRGDLNQNIHHLSRCIIWYADASKWVYRGIRVILWSVSPSLERDWDWGRSALAQSGLCKPFAPDCPLLGKIRPCSLLVGCKLLCLIQLSASVFPFHLPRNCSKFLLTCLTITLWGYWV